MCEEGTMPETANGPGVTVICVEASKALAWKHQPSRILGLRRGLQLVKGHQALWGVTELLSDKAKTGVNDSTTALTIAQTRAMTRGWWECLTGLVK